MYKNQIKELENEIRFRQKAVSKAPKGEINLSKSNGYTQFRINGNGRTYLPKSNYDLILQLVQKKFDQRFINNAKSEIRILKRMDELNIELTSYLGNICEKVLNQTYCEMKMPYRKYILEVESDEEYIERWLGEYYETNNMEFGDTHLVSLSGRRVRSKSELEICNILDNLSLPYRYEARLELQNGYCSYPDFTILDIRTRTTVYWEHFGMCDSPDYATNAMMKLFRYSLCGIRGDTNLITTFESSKVPINTEYIRDMLIDYFDLKEK